LITIIAIVIMEFISSKSTEYFLLTGTARCDRVPRLQEIKSLLVLDLDKKKLLGKAEIKRKTAEVGF